MLLAHDVFPEVTGGALVAFALALLAIIANRSGHAVMAAFLAAAAWLFVGFAISIWFWSKWGTRMTA